MVGDYQVKQEVIDLAIKKLGLHVWLDVFASRTDKLLTKYCNMLPDHGAYKIDAFSLNCERLSQYLHHHPVKFILIFLIICSISFFARHLLIHHCVTMLCKLIIIVLSGRQYSRRVFSVINTAASRQLKNFKIHVSLYSPTRIIGSSTQFEGSSNAPHSFTAASVFIEKHGVFSWKFRGLFIFLYLSHHVRSPRTRLSSFHIPFHL
ncbi:MAG: hypothetical protein EZS28_054731, partial [Streblomastix strix]